MSRVWDSNRQSGTDLVILLALADRAGDDGISWPSLESLRERSRLADDRQVRRILRKLEQAGDIFTIQAAGRGHTNLYMVCVGMTQDEIATALVKRAEVSLTDATAAAADIVASRDASEKGDISAQKGVDTPPITETEKGDISAQKGTRTPPISGGFSEKGVCTPPGTNTRDLNPSSIRERERVETPLPPSQQSTNGNGAAVVHKQGSPYMTGLLLPGGHVPAGAGENAVQVYYERFHYSDPEAHLTRPKEDDLIRLCPDLDRLREVVTEYSRTNYRAGNVKLILDWYRDGVPARQANTNGGTNGNAITGNGKNGNGNGWNAGGRGTADQRKPWADYKDPQWTAEEMDRYGALLAGRAQ